MWDEIKGYVTFFIVIPLALGGAWYVGYWAFTGEWPNPPRGDCVTEWDGVSNPSRCD